MIGSDDWIRKTVLVVGGSGGIGSAAAEEFANAGANIAIADLHVGNLPSNYLAIPADITRVAGCESTIRKTKVMCAHLQMTGIWRQLKLGLISR